ncbi:MAG: hypothetical protein HQM14_21435 [SAR324 cluster bacterium]|nr:hypothetical protein [SAR324 cluster bacterium]
MIKPPKYTLLSVKTESSWSWYGPTHVFIFNEKDDQLWIKGVKEIGEEEKELGALGSRIITEHQFDQEKYDNMMVRLQKITIPAFPVPIIGCDGGVTEFTINGGYGQEASYRWWSIVAEGWEPLADIAEEIFDESGIYDKVESISDK